MTKIKHVFFDLDHTLWDFDKNSELALKQLFKDKNINCDFDKFHQHYLIINHAYWKRIEKGEVSKEELKYGRFKDAFEVIDYTVSSELIKMIADEYLNYLAEQTLLFDDAIAVLEEFKEKYTLHIISNGFQEIQHYKIEKSGLLPYFKTIVNAETVGVKKPNPKIYHYALDLAGAKPKESIMIGDNLDADVYGALAVGLDAIYFNYKYQEVPENIKAINQLIQLKEFL
jgi:putative hydrolase of the HAD superfamily